MKKNGFKLSGSKIGIVATLLLFVICLLHGPKTNITLIERLELTWLDTLFKLRGKKNPGNEVKIIAVDDKSITKLGRWPWDRAKFSELIDILIDAKVKVIGFDIIFSEPQITQEQKKLNELEKSFKKLNLQSLNKDSSVFYKKIINSLEAIDNDNLLGNSFKKAGNVVLAVALDPESRVEESKAAENDVLENLSRFSYFLTEDPGLIENALQPPEARTVLPPLIPFMEKVLSVGNAQAIITDLDGISRKESLVVKYRDFYYPPFGLEIARAYLDIPFEKLKIIFGQGIKLDKIFIPTDERERYLINFNGPQNTFKYYSFSDVLDGKFPKEEFSGKVALIGYAATGLGDKWATPFQIMFGVEKQATVIENIIHQNFLNRPANAFIFEMLALLILGVISSVILPKLSPLNSTFFSTGMIFIYLLFTVTLFIFYSTWINAVFPTLTTLSSYIVITSYRFLTEEKEKRKIRGAFQQYLSPEVVQEIIKDPSKLKLGGEEKILSILFSDVRGFTTISEKLKPDELVKLLNEYFNAMTEVITNIHKGTLDKFIGDAIMAFWGAPVDLPDHPLRACLSALGMIKKLKELQEKWIQEGKPKVEIGIGINTGMVVVGNMGSDSRFDYTVMGDSVNLASRLEGLTRTYGINIIISEFTLSTLENEFVTRELDCVRVKGKVKPVKIFELIDEKPLSSDKSDVIEIFHTGLKSYKKRSWEKGIEEFQKALKIDPDDIPSKIYLERCIAFKSAPPPDDWDGVFTMKTK
ncbi:MAG: hypothetical protein A3C43_10375 [Candidatus Schekmanbacteria bacterium RIFCSPHIGHO2_02_FULL_38_11]|uniref:Guanylate cyclase domain-containing protein n=1 Tax=Candidatus Schekmanbacteria bacterium RIFCSPLOWO2_12_FULL_38_15 TaxID=1817883 RepID=A0A1F7SIW4_9BACT|nr:MAG: hypothetical protein A2043_07175 [Candidatus Schekmanbacteria bacterium GWA2_38_9]OGL49254.1 MAG: hypothetical protein A3H37_04750 [Candidatus Schekmanbacteria bacterium RIFCSPLOWO2_02_FULL_38_14]OGL53709.1 MAG: hypothetical protein A3G31_03105 [Candidatus Schekmanbacteria bacterium RIFCSPLOWO2_12_FULL_38_15]OGL54728.1 MAG: hypothetical protein A3C43_10375 [Candidatus Schekmanbacteria bacterium RIFCSPHIGHO2_02_FULL_38_11]